MTDQFLMWCVYRFPRDYPGLYVARRWTIAAGEALATSDVVTSLTLDGVRAQLPPGLHCIARLLGDDPGIVETWI